MIKLHCVLSLLILSSCSLFTWAGKNSTTQVSNDIGVGHKTVESTDTSALNRPQANAVTAKNNHSYSNSNPYINKDDWGDNEKPVRAGVDSNSVVDNSALIDGLVDSISSWRRDWESMDTDRYLLNYSVAFHNGIYNYKQWSKRKKAIIGSKNYIRVGMEDIRVQLSNSNLVARVTFWQDFLSDSFADQGRKLQYWMKIKHNKWHIISERTMPEDVYQYSETNSLTTSMVLTPAISKYSIGQCTDRADCEKRNRDNCAKEKTQETCLARK